jgi:3-hydroxy-9,10-secoandrosta-1,3,5(10)-triene-9,17-dione monooxygenase
LSAAPRAPDELGLPVPEPDLKARQIIARAEALRQSLVDRQAETEALTWYPEATHQEFLKAGFYRILQPRRFGGYEFDTPTFFKVVIEISRGCPSTGWCYCLSSAHIMQIAGLFGDEALGEIVGPDGDFRAASYGFHGGEFEPVPGGWRITGKWPYASGAPYSTHFIGQAHLPPDEPDGKPVEILFVLPRSEWSLCSDWGDVMGLKGSGSHSVEAKGGFLPASHVVRANLVAGRGDVAPSRSHPVPMYAGRMASFFCCELVAVAVGAAKGALDEYARLITTKTATMFPGTLRVDLQDYQRYYGQAAGKIAAAEAVVMRIAEEHMELSRRAAEEGEPYPAEVDMRNLIAAQEAGRLAWDAVQGIIFRTAGSSAARDGQRLQRYFRDLSTYWTHNAPATDDWFAVQYAQLIFGKGARFGAGPT